MRSYIGGIDNFEDTIDSRRVIERIKELEEERDDHEETRDQNIDRPWSEEYEGSAKELKALEALAREVEPYAEDWKYGATLIRDSYLTEYTRELLADIGDLPRDLPSYLVIDWEATAKNIQADCTSVDFDGVTYWVRN